MTRTPLDILHTVFGYEVFRDQQAEIVDHLVAGGDALVLMPTGGGKSLCYQIPALVRPGTGVVVSPLIALMQDQVTALRQHGIRAAFLNSTLPPADARRVETLLRRGELDLLYIAPERLLQERTLALLTEIQASGPPAGLALFAIDEAHCVSQWGHDFRPEYLQLDILNKHYPGVPRLACTATADERTRQEIVTSLGLTAGRIFVTGFDRPNIQYRVVQKNNPRRQLLDLLRDEHPGDAGIVYCLSRKRVEQIAEYLTREGVRALPYHAGMGKKDREANQRIFQHEDGVVMVATIAFGMGIDKPDVRFVAHLDLPRSLEAYYQETGRAGRDGLPATAWLAYGLQDVILLRKMMETSEADELHKRGESQKLDAMLGYCEVVDCRRQVLLGYFGEELAEPCGNCDTCLQPVETFDGTIVAQKALSCVVRTGQRFGAQYLVDVLLGRENERIHRFGHHRLSTYGIGTELDISGWRSVIRQLVARGLLAVDPEGYGGLRLTEAAGPILHGAETLLLRKDVARRRRQRRRTPRGRVSISPEATISPGAVAAIDATRATGAGRSARPAKEDLVDPEAVALFERLRKKRYELAQTNGIPPYVIFHDTTLAAMALHRPASPLELLQISGVGEKKLQRYGETFLAVINEIPDGAVSTNSADAAAGVDTAASDDAPPGGTSA